MVLNTNINIVSATRWIRVCHTDMIDKNTGYVLISPLPLYSGYLPLYYDDANGVSKNT